MFQRPLSDRSQGQDWTVRWLTAFEAALRTADAGRIASLFVEDSHWRDVVAFDWAIRPVAGRAAIAATLAQRRPCVGACRFRLASGRPSPNVCVRHGRSVIEAFFEFETNAGRAAGIVRLALGEEETETPRAWFLLTSLVALEDSPRPSDVASDADVLVVGAGQAGLSLAARLDTMGASYLVIEKNGRVGDNWRRRYPSLVLHNPIAANHLPYLPFPADYPRYLPRDMLADWLEQYAQTLELEVATGTRLCSARYEATTARWTAVIQGPSGRQTLRPRHLVFAAGAASVPVLPDLPGLPDFAGAIQHTDGFRGGAAWRGRSALVLGAGGSGHDVALDLYRHGCATTLVQRGPTTVASVAPSDSLLWSSFEENELADADLLSMASVYPLALESARRAASHMAELDRQMIEGLQTRGYKFDLGDDETGHIMKQRRQNGGYYLDTGCAQPIIDGEIGLLDAKQILRFEHGGARLACGALAPADLLVCATGYRSQREVVRQTLGSAVAERVGEVWGVGHDGEMNNLWKPTAQPGLWFMAGSLAQCRVYSKYLAFQLIANLSDGA